MSSIDTVLLLDVENPPNPLSTPDDELVLNLANILGERQLTGIFSVIGTTAQGFAERKRQDVIQAISRHSVGTHTLSEQHPVMPEYCADLGWREGVDAIREREGAGLDIIRDVFEVEPASLSRHGYHMAPQVHAYAAEVGKTYIYGPPAAPPWHGPTWYCGALNLPFPGPWHFSFRDDVFCDTTRFQQRLDELDRFVDSATDARASFISIFLSHPHMLRWEQLPAHYWYPNGTNVPEEERSTGPQPTFRSEKSVQIAIANLTRLADRIANDERIGTVSIPEFEHRYGRDVETITTADLTAAAQYACTERRILVGEHATPAEACLALAESVLTYDEGGAIPERIERRTVAGPREMPPIMPETWSVDARKFMDVVRGFVATCHESGELPHQLHEWGAAVGLGSFYRALAGSYVRVLDGAVLDRIEFEMFDRYPAEAKAIGDAYYEIPEFGSVRPDLDTSRLCRLARLQTWTMKPAIRH